MQLVYGDQPCRPFHRFDRFVDVGQRGFQNARHTAMQSFALIVVVGHIAKAGVHLLEVGFHDIQQIVYLPADLADLAHGFQVGNTAAEVAPGCIAQGAVDAPAGLQDLEKDAANKDAVDDGQQGGEQQPVPGIAGSDNQPHNRQVHQHHEQQKPKQQSVQEQKAGTGSRDLPCQKTHQPSSPFSIFIIMSR
ncbi:hypothetical protein [Pseudomonas sp.]|uniref:hypothetical protein n=1 Tax=Pseudomonas sp. TaxID=306 RepID=UPI003CC68645